MPEHDDAELERLVRGSLDLHAGEVDTAVPVATRARTAARRRRGGRIAVGAASLAVAAVAITAVIVDRADSPSQPDVPVASPPSTSPTPPPGWRAEYWHDLRIEVPQDWGWGTAPTRTGIGGDRNLYLCGGPGAMRTTDESSRVLADPTVPYVGRPIMLSDACLGGDVLLDPKAPYVWLGADLPPGTQDVGNGYTQETVLVGGTAVTVGTDNPALREQVLASASVGGPCPPSLGSRPRVEPGEDGTPKAADSLLVCAYRAEADGSYPLVYADELDAAAAAATEDAILSEPVLTGDCLNASGGEWAMLTARGDGWARQYAVDLNCPGVTDYLGRMHRLEPPMVEPWAVNGLPASLYGPYGGKGEWFGSFIGMLG